MAERAGVPKRLSEAWDREQEVTAELESTYAHIRAVVENCKHSPVGAIRHQLVGLLPEVRTFDPDVAARMRAKGLGHLVERQEHAASVAWAEYGYGGPVPDSKEE